MRRPPLPAAAGLTLLLAGCGAETDPAPTAIVEAPSAASSLSLPVRGYPASPGGAGLVVAHDPTLGDLVGGPAGLFAAGEALVALDPAPVTGLAAYAPSQVVVGATDGVSVFTGALARSPLSEALSDMSVRAIAATDGGLWLGTEQALYRWQDDALLRFEGPGGIAEIAAPRAGTRLTVRGEAGIFLLDRTPEGWSQADLSAERPLDAAFALTDGTVLGLFEGALFRRVPVEAGRVAWRPQALEPNGEGATGVIAAAQDPERGAVWLALADQLARIDGPQVAWHPTPNPITAVTGLAVDDRGAVWLDDGATVTRIGTEAAPITWQGAVAQFSADNCERCHAPLGTAHPLDDFDAWKAEVDLIITALEEGRMPLDGAPLVGGGVETIRRWKEDGLLY